MADANLVNDKTKPTKERKVPVSTIFITSVVSQFAQFIPVLVVILLSSYLFL